MADAFPTPEEVALLARHAGLDLPAEYLQQLVSAYRPCAPNDRSPAARACA